MHIGRPALLSPCVCLSSAILQFYKLCQSANGGIVSIFLPLLGVNQVMSVNGLCCKCKNLELIKEVDQIIALINFGVVYDFYYNYSCLFFGRKGVVLGLLFASFLFRDSSVQCQWCRRGLRLILAGIRWEAHNTLNMNTSVNHEANTETNKLAHAVTLIQTMCLCMCIYVHITYVHAICNNHLRWKIGFVLLVYLFLYILFAISLHFQFLKNEAMLCTFLDYGRQPEHLNKPSASSRLHHKT